MLITYLNNVYGQEIAPLQERNDLDGQVTIPTNIDIGNFEDCLNFYLEVFENSQSTQHEFFIELLPFLSEITEQVLPILYNQEAINILANFNNITFWDNETESVFNTGNFNFDDFFYWSNYGGLTQTEWYLNTIANNPTLDANGIPILGTGNIINPIEYYKIYSYSQKIFSYYGITTTLANISNPNFDDTICD